MKLFLFLAFFGWIIEIIAFSSGAKRLTNNHYLLLPFCPMYGIAGIIILELTKNTNNFFVIFLISVLVATIIEYTTSFLLEKTFKIRWWSYSYKKFNFQGRICLINALEFGLLGFLASNFYPILLEVDIGKAWESFWSILFFIDVIISTYYTYMITNYKMLKFNIISGHIKNKIKNNRFLFS